MSRNDPLAEHPIKPRTQRRPYQPPKVIARFPWQVRSVPLVHAAHVRRVREVCGDGDQQRGEDGRGRRGRLWRPAFGQPHPAAQQAAGQPAQAALHHQGQDGRQRAVRARTELTRLAIRSNDDHPIVEPDSFLTTYDPILSTWNAV